MAVYFHFAKKESHVASSGEGPSVQRRRSGGRDAGLRAPQSSKSLSSSLSVRFMARKSCPDRTERPAGGP